MKVRVQRRDGSIETITLVPPITVGNPGDKLTQFSCGDGTEHWFTLDGYYDGWGRMVNLPSIEAASELIAKVEESREIHKLDEKTDVGGEN